jgi:three-Cys-motif partner protein
MPRTPILPGPDDPAFFQLTPKAPPTTVAVIERPIWTEHKARLIARYLRYFVFITKHGTYIDGFAGPQANERSDMWAAKLVIENEPRWLRQFFLFDSEATKVAKLRGLVREQSPRKRGEPQRRISVRKGDFNTLVRGVLRSSAIKDKEATFCLLDQRTFECTWRTVAALAAHKRSGMKIEVFYFLANLWLDRALAAATTPAKRREIRRWWGNDDWERLRDMRQPDRARLFAKRLQSLGYAYAMEWPIYERKGGKGHVMYYMIHATDHPEAPKLMRRAYNNAVNAPEPQEQLQIELSQPPSVP